MKKIFVFLLTVIILLGICSCGETTQLGTNPNSNKTNESDISENNKDPNNSEPNNDKENTKENQSNVVISTEIKPHNYYSTIADENIDIPFPNEYGSYLKMISSKDEFSLYSSYEIDENIFNENYIMAINIHNEWIDDALKDVGFYNLKEINKEFCIEVDYYDSNDYYSSLEIPIEFNITRLLVVNKSEIDYFSEIQNITVNATKLKNEKIDLIGVTEETPIENYAYAYVIEDTEQNNEVMDKLHLNHHNWNDYLLLYMPDLNQYDFILKEKQIVEGDLYLTIEQYFHKDNAKFNEQGTGFYHIYEYPRDGSESKIDFDDLKENFNIYITVCIVNVPQFSDLVTPNDNKDNLVEVKLPVVSYSHPNFNELNGLGQFKDLKMDTSTDKLSIYEIWSLNDGMPDTDNYTPLDYNDYEVVFPKEVHEIVYLIIPKKELPNSMHINGEVKLRKGISKAE